MKYIEIMLLGLLIVVAVGVNSCYSNENLCDNTDMEVEELSRFSKIPDSTMIWEFRNNGKVEDTFTLTLVSADTQMVEFSYKEFIEVCNNDWRFCTNFYESVVYKFQSTGSFEWTYIENAIFCPSFYYKINYNNSWGANNEGLLLADYDYNSPEEWNNFDMVYQKDSGLVQLLWKKKMYLFKRIK